jgi:hypothetical protein
MSTPKPAPSEPKELPSELKESLSEPAQVPSADYLALLETLQEIERDYKLGDVDAKISNPTPGQTPWKFEARLNETEQSVNKYKERLLRENPSWYYKFVAIQAEAKAYFDTATTAYRLDLYQKALDLYREILNKKKEALKKKAAPEPPVVDEEEGKRLKNMVRVIIAGLEYLHTTGEFGTAIAYAQDLYEFVNKSLATKDNQAFGTKSVICYFLGRMYRQRGTDSDYRQAIEYFYQCSDYYFELANRRNNHDNRSKTEDVIYARTRAMVSLAFGAGFLYYNAQSDLARAKGLIAQARLAFLKNDGYPCCEFHYTYLELLYASILREEAGEILPHQVEEGTPAAEEQKAAKEKLNRALEIITRCEGVLEGKPSYYIRLLYNKALVYLYQGRDKYPAARACIKHLLERCYDSPRWYANALVLKSRLERREGNAETALEDAIRAFNQAGSHLPVKIEALLARGKAQQERRNLAGARADFEKAHQLNNGANKRLEVISLILLAQVAIAQQQPRVAQEWFAQAKAIIPAINHGFILNRFRRLEAEISNYKSDFVIRSNDENLNYESHEKALRCWLLEKALREDSNLTRVAQRLGVSKKTLYQWRDTYQVRV